MVWPWAIRSLNDFIRVFMSWKWRPVDGSSKMNNVGVLRFSARK